VYARNAENFDSDWTCNGKYRRSFGVRKWPRRFGGVAPHARRKRATIAPQHLRLPLARSIVVLRVPV
jgi:hypothetical protein